MFATKIYKNHIYGDIYTVFFFYIFYANDINLNTPANWHNKYWHKFIHIFLFVKFLFTSKIYFLQTFFV